MIYVTLLMYDNVSTQVVGADTNKFCFTIFLCNRQNRSMCFSTEGRPYYFLQIILSFTKKSVIMLTSEIADLNIIILV